MEKAIEALLTMPDSAKAAAAIGVSARTLQRWRRRQDFADALRKARSQGLQTALTHLSRASTGAVTILVQTMVDQYDSKIDQRNYQNRLRHQSNKIKAARAVLEYSMRGIHLMDHGDSDAERVLSQDEVIRAFVASVSAAAPPRTSSKDAEGPNHHHPSSDQQPGGNGRASGNGDAH